MPEVPPDEYPPLQDPPQEQPPQDSPHSGDGAFVPPPRPFRRSVWTPPAAPEPAEPLPPPAPVAPAVAPPPPSELPAGASATPPASPATTGVPHYTPPAPTAQVALGVDGAGAGGIAAPAERRPVWRPLGRGLRELAETVILALVIFLLVRAVVQNFQVEGASMEPTLESEWYLLVNKSLYWEINLNTVNKFVPFVDPGEDPTRYIFRGPRRGDVIVFQQPDQNPDSPERDFIKRVIGVPGDTVEIRDCTVYVNGSPLDEPYINEPTLSDEDPVVVPEGTYWVMGDNRNHSSDSRTWGPVPKENIIGQAFLVYWPFDVFGLVDNRDIDPGSEVVEPKGCAPVPEEAPAEAPALP